jgi:DNA polymerase elongation subunit (family B)
MAIKELVDVNLDVMAKTTVDTNGDLSQYSDEQLCRAWVYASNQEKYYDQTSDTEKLFMNSIYGATGTIYFPFCNYNTAEDITGEGKYYILKGQQIINTYLNDKWHLDTDTHEKLVAELGQDKFTKPFGTKLPYMDFVLYIDTDSIYVEYDQLIQSVGFTGKATELILALHGIRIKELFATELGRIVDKRHGENFLLFDLELVAAMGIFLAKKKYVLGIEWTDKKNIIYDDPHNHIKGKGVAIAQRGTSKMVIQIIKLILGEIVSDSLTSENWKTYMRNAWVIFEKAPLEMCCKYIGLNKTGDYIDYADVTGYGTLYRALPQHKGAARHTHLILKNKLGGKYPQLSDGEKISVYLDVDGIPFAFEQGNFPYEFAPEISKEFMFEKLIIKPLTRFAEVAGYDMDNILGKTTQVRI